MNRMLGNPSVTIAVLTFKRPRDIDEALPLLVEQIARYDGAGTVLVIDNDANASAADVVGSHADPRITYVVESTPGIAAARNRALSETTTDLIIFIDDDERPSHDWLSLMVGEYRKHPGTLGVFGLVDSTFGDDPDPWLVAGKFFERRKPPTGTSLDVVATNNLLLDMARLRELDLRFDNAYGISGGSDTMFSRQARQRGGTIFFCGDALVHDVVPADRATRQWVLKRAHRSGNSWSRTQIDVIDSAPKRLAARLKLTASGLARVGFGITRGIYGFVTRNLSQRAQGARNIYRGAGLISGAWGHTHVEYARKK